MNEGTEKKDEEPEKRSRYQEQKPSRKPGEAGIHMGLGALRLGTKLFPAEDLPQCLCLPEAPRNTTASLAPLQRSE